MKILNVKCTYHDKKDNNYSDLNKGVIKLYQEKDGSFTGSFSFVNNEIEIDFEAPKSILSTFERNIEHRIQGALDDLKYDIQEVLGNH